MRMSGFSVLALSGALLLAAGCNQTPASVNTAPFKAALNAYYQSHPSCAFDQPVTFPVTLSPDGDQPDSSDLQRYQALADAGLLAKKSKKEWVAAGSVRVHETIDDYELTDQGKSAWTKQGSGGNFCYATPHVTSIEHYTPEPDNTRYGVSYHFTDGSLPSWTENAKVKAAFPAIAAATTPNQAMTGLATLTKTDNGWNASGISSLTPLPVPQGSSSSKADNGSGNASGSDSGSGQ